MDAAIALSDVEIRIPGVGTILGPISLRVGRGERWAVLGANGSGKTTLLSVAGAWRQPSAGDAEILGRRLGRTDVRALRTRIGHVGHRLTERLRPRMPVLEVVLTGRDATLETWTRDYSDDERAEAILRLEDAGCLALADRPIGACSQGERARVLLARAFYARHELLLLDEPAAGLDLPAREHLVAAMEALGAQPEPPTSLLATHHLEEIPPDTSHAVVLRGGRALVAGPIDDVVTGDWLTEAFEMPIDVERRGRRWSAFGVGAASAPRAR